VKVYGVAKKARHIIEAQHMLIATRGACRSSVYTHLTTPRDEADYKVFPTDICLNLRIYAMKILAKHNRNAQFRQALHQVACICGGIPMRSLVFHQKQQAGGGSICRKHQLTDSARFHVQPEPYRSIAFPHSLIAIC
jgi:hypothetical protein